MTSESKAHELIGAEFVKQPLMPQDTEDRG